ncbi:Zinc transporter ZIP11 [Acipenser ruthenus]|uniref:Zinc transporter ZIP11 n=1 Tax=Acipenser ruthenus TaxID=7906 RepID=A0A444UP56_ACIRT|nr:Zinc transporter ZIP11 [Acipenser ruthenus]
MACKTLLLDVHRTAHSVGNFSAHDLVQQLTAFAGVCKKCGEALYGQLSGMVEPVAGVLGAFAVVVAEPLHPYALAFAARAMVYVAMDNIIPEAQVR